MTHQTTRPREWLRTAARILLAPYLITLLLTTWLPEDEAERITGLVSTFASWIEAFGVPFAVGYPVLEFVANIALFVPFGLLIALARPRTPLWRIVAAGFATSCVIEVVQVMIPSRFPMVSDVVANTLGVLIGCLVVWRLRIALSGDRHNLESWTSLASMESPPQ